MTNINIAVILNGCGHQDGSEIHEAVITMLCLEQAGATLHCLSVNKPQTQVINHLTGAKVDQQRNLIEESARIARGRIKEIRKVNPDDFDGVVIPGGSGTAANLCTFAKDGDRMVVDPDVVNFLQAIHESKKPIGAVCIAPVILAKVFGKLTPKLTIGTDKATAAAMEKMGAKHVECNVSRCIVDEQQLLITTPAYMLGKNLKDIYGGIEALAQELIKLTKRRG